MRLFRGMLAIAAMTVGAAPLAGCNSSGSDAATAPADNAAAAAPVSQPSENDATDDTAPATAAPPPLQVETPGPAPSPTQLWVAGTWRYTGGRYVWSKGFWQARRDGYAFHQARWVDVGGRWEHHVAHWVSEKPGLGHPEHTDDHDRPRPAAETRPAENRPAENGRAGENPKPADDRTHPGGARPNEPYHR